MRKRFLSALLCLSLLLSLVPGIRAAEGENLDFTPAQLPTSGLELSGPELPMDTETENPPRDTDLVKVIVLLEDKSVLETNARATYNASARKQMDALLETQEQVLEAVRQLAGRELKVAYRYTWLVNGVALSVPYGSIEQIENLDGVRRVLLQQRYTVCETSAADTAALLSGEDPTGAEAAWALGYTGKGIKIAVIDTGLDSDHPSFDALPDSCLTEDSATVQTLSNVLESLNAFARCPELTPEDLYRSSKVAFGFNYSDNNTIIDHLDSQGSHGTHVAGVAAANREPEPRAAGTAPDAQLFIMKVFGANGGAYTQDILAAIEDALLLGADVINLSLGAPAGFTSGDTTAQGDSLDEFYRAVAATGTVLCVSAGNFYNSGYRNRWGTDANLSLYPDNGAVGSPGTYTDTVTVASAEIGNKSALCIRAGELRIPYTDCAGYGLPALTTLREEYPVVLIPGTGEKADYTGLDVRGKIVLVQRGGISFLEKHIAAEAAGAAGLLVYNNADDIFSMDMSGTHCTTPAAALSGSDGEKLKAALEENSALLISFSQEAEELPGTVLSQMSDYSAWGPGPDLALTPDITAPGGNIYSTIDGGSYGLMSGTSMASPAAAGMAALVLQYLQEVHPKLDRLTTLRNLLGSTAQPLEFSQTEDLPYSPRNQGAGLADVARAVTSGCFLMVSGADFPKIDLGDDPAKTGVYAFSFQVQNISGTDAYYSPSLSVMTEGTFQSQGQLFLSGTPVLLDAVTAADSAALVLTHDTDNSGRVDSRDARLIWEAAQGHVSQDSLSFRYDPDRDGTATADDVQQLLDALVGNTSGDALTSQVLKVPAGETITVNTSIALAESGRQYLDTHFPNGGYVEGYVRLEALNRDGTDLSLPYLGFYGSWAQAPVLDTGSYWDLLNAPEGQVVGNQSIHLLQSQYDGREKGIYPGMNPYLEDEPFDISHICLSPNGDGNLDSLSDISISLLRSAGQLTLRITNRDTGEVLWTARERNISKTLFRETAGRILPWSWDRDGTGTDFDFRGLENGTRLLLEAEVSGVWENAQTERWSVPISIDLEAPELLEAQRFTQEDTGNTILRLRFRENLAAAAVIVADGGGTKVLQLEGLEEPSEDGIYIKDLDITGLTGKIHVILADYGANQSAYAIHLGGEGIPYGELLGFQLNFTDSSRSWVSFSRDVQKNEIPVYPAEEIPVTAADYALGCLYAQREDGSMVRLEAEDLLQDQQVTGMAPAGTLERVYLDLTWDQKQELFYGLYQNPRTNAAEVYALRYLEAENRWQEEFVTSQEALSGFCLASDSRGTLYLLGTLPGSREATLFAIREDPDSGSMVWQELGSLGLTMRNPQSMTFDPDTQTLLWARFDLEMAKPQCQLAEISLVREEGREIPKARILGPLSGQVLGLTIPQWDR